MTRMVVLPALAGLIVAVVLASQHVASVTASEPPGTASSQGSIGAAGMPATEISAEALKALLQQLKKEFSGIRSLQAEFVQEKHLSIFEDVAQTNGVCLFLRPQSIRFEIQEPFQSIVIADGKQAAKYEHLDGKWQKLKMADSEALLVVMGQIAAWLQGDFDQQTDIYDIRARQGDCVSLILIPRPKALLQIITSIELQLDKDKKKFTSVTMREPGGDYTVMTFVSELRNADLSAEMFDVSAAVPVEYRKAAGTSEATSRPSGAAGGKAMAERR